MFGRMMKWAVELSEYNIRYRPWLSLKGQVLVDFMVELSQRLVQLDPKSQNNGGFFM